MFFDGSFFLKGFCKLFNIHLLFRSQRPKTTGICNKDPNWHWQTKNFTCPASSQMVKAACLLQLWPESRNRDICKCQNLIPVKLFQNLTSDFWEQDFFALYRHEFLHVCIVQKAPIHQSHIYRQIKILRTIFEKGHRRNIPVELFQNLTSGFME